MPTEGAWQIKMDQLQQKLEEYKERITASVEVLRTAVSRIPDCLLVLGSGLGALADQVGDPVVLPYDTLPGFSRTSVAGHQGRLLFGWWQNRYVAVMQGRFHYYEGYGMADVVLPIRVMCRLGVPRLILTNAAGGVRRNLRPGDLMLIEDHIGLFAESPLRGPNDAMFGPRFPDQSHVYDPVWRALAASCAADLAIPLHSGVYAWCRGPQYETPAEIRLLERLGADAVGMSTVPEAIAAVHGGMKVLAISCITNMAAGILDQPLDHDEVMQVGRQASAATIRLLSALLNRTGEERT